MRFALHSPLLRVAVAAALVAQISACGKTPTDAPPPPPSVSVGTEIDDSVMTTQIKSALLDNAEIKSFDFKVETRKGEVMLSGFVENTAQMDRAIAVANGVSGVKTVINKMELKGQETSVGNKIDDSVITAKIKAALLADASVKSLDIAVITRKGEVQLSGFVNSQSQMDQAMKIAHSTEGVSNVGNEMSVKK